MWEILKKFLKRSSTLERLNIEVWKVLLKKVIKFVNIEKTPRPLFGDTSARCLQEILAEPYVHQEPALSPEALGEVATGATGYAAGPLVVAGWSGACRNNLGQAVPCRQ